MLSPEHRRFLVVDQLVGSIVINFILNAAIAWAMFRSVDAVPLWGQSSIAGDTIATAFILPLLTSLIVSRLVLHQVRSGQLSPLPLAAAFTSPWPRRSSVRRGAAVGAVAIVLAAVPVVLVLTFAGPAEMERWRFIWFKAAFASALGAFVTPLLAWWALARASDQRIVTPVSHSTVAPSP